MKRIFLFLLPFSILFSEPNLKAQVTRKVLFLGNSYTGVNNLPQIVSDMALSAGDTLIFDSHTPGGYQLIDHGADVTSQNKIMAGDWNYVVLQGQSQEPITNISQFNNGGIHLNNVISQYNPCSVTMMYMTWGRKNGDATNCSGYPVMCTYEGMDSTLRNRYLSLATSINGEVSPVSVAWNFIRQNYPTIELYQPDESHPSVAGSYAAACSFYTTIFKKDPTFITFNFGLDTATTAIIKNVVKAQVFDNLNSWDLKQMPVSDFQYRIGPGTNEVIFTTTNFVSHETYHWDFGDGTTDSIQNPTHSYLTDGTFTVTLTTTNCDLEGFHTSSSDTIIQFCSHTPTVYTTDPWICENDTLWTQLVDSYQWYFNGSAIPETNQSMFNFHIYGIGNYSVLSSVNGCSELSTEFSDNPEWSGYYFDLFPPGDPCVGDTVPFSVSHINGFLSGFESILWYKNDTLLLFMNNEDTLYITSGGAYECLVVNPNSNCPLDTTSSSIITFDCGIIGIENELFVPIYSIISNPVSETLIMQFADGFANDEILIYNILGNLVKVAKAFNRTEINVSDLANGLYFVRLKNLNHPALKFIKQSD
jgi:PKD repeat protein